MAVVAILPFRNSNPLDPSEGKNRGHNSGIIYSFRFYLSATCILITLYDNSERLQHLPTARPAYLPQEQVYQLAHVAVGAH